MNGFKVKKIKKDSEKVSFFAGRLGKSFFAFALGAFLVFNIANVGAQTANPPAGDVDANFSSLTVGDGTAGNDDVTVNGNTRIDGDLDVGGRIVPDSEAPSAIERQTVQFGGVLQAQGIGRFVLDTDPTNGQPFRMLDEVTFEGPINGDFGPVGSKGLYLNDDLYVDGVVDAEEFRNGGSGGTDSITFDDNVYINNSLFVRGAQLSAENITVANSIGAYFKVTDRKDESDASDYSPIGRRAFVVATCPSGTYLTGCSGNLYEGEYQVRFDYLGSRESGANSCYSYARRISNSDTRFDHYAIATCFDPSVSGRSDIIEY